MTTVHTIDKRTNNLSLNKRFISLLGSYTFLILAFLSLYFYKERAVFLDLAYIIFKVIQTDSLAIQVNRFVSFFTHGCAYTAFKFGLPLSAIAQIYSLSFVLFQAVFFFIILKVIKNEMLALGLLLFNVLMVTHSFYWTPSELIQGMAFVFVFFALLNNLFQHEKSNKYLSHFFLLVALVTSSFAHPLLNVPVAFGLCFMALKYPSKKITCLLYFFALIIIFLIKQTYFSNSYDQSAASGIQNFVKLFPNYYTPSFKSFTGYLIKDYYFLSVSLIGLSSFYILKKQYLKLSLVLVFFISYAFLINVSFPKNQHQFYLESQYLPLCFFIILPLVLDVIPHLKNKKWPAYLLIFVVLIGFIRIFITHDFYTERVEWQRSLLNKCEAIGEDKIVLMDKELPKDVLMLTWGLSFETWLLSTIEKDKTMSVVAIRNEKQFDKDLEKPMTYLSMWNKTAYKNLDSRYFKFIDTTSYYKKYSYKELVK